MLTTVPAYDERLHAPLWWWLVGIGLVALLGAEFVVGLPVWVATITFVVFGAVAGALLLFVGAARVTLRDGELWAGRAHLPLNCVGAVQVLDRAAVRRAIGVEADPTAYVVYRPWLPGAVRIEIDDPEDDTPYWLVGSRRPQRLARALLASRLNPS
jgi:hypothetical protein